MIEQVREAIREKMPEDHFGKLVRSGSTIQLKQFTGATISFLLKELSEIASHVLVVSPDMEKATSLIADLETLETRAETLLFPPTNRRPYDDEMVTDLSSTIQRAEVLEHLGQSSHAVVATSAEALVEKLLPPDEFTKRSIRIERGQQHDPETLRVSLASQGYQSVRFVSTPGEFAVRGGIFDVYPFSGEYPVRLEFFGNEVESIREFDPDSQRSVAFLEEAKFVPNSTFETAKGDERRESLIEYLPQDVVLLIHNPDLIQKQIGEWQKMATERFLKNGSEEHPPPEALYLSTLEYDNAIGDKTVFAFGSFQESATPAAHQIDLDGTPHPEYNGNFKLLRSDIEERSRTGYHTWILCNNKNQLERFEELLGESSDDFRYSLRLNTLHEGFILEQKKLTVLTDHQIFNRYHRPSVKKRRHKGGGISFKELRDLNVGDYVVHVDYGIGRFSGFKTIEVKGSVQEAAVLTYQGNSTLYVNVSSLHKLQKYSGKEGTAPRITKLGSGEWARKKSRTRKKVKDIARELIRLYAKRKAQTAFAYSPDLPWQKEMEARFEFEETPDQMEAIRAVKEDMESEHPMDRLVCGDVGFGKTEVAIRAAFKSVMEQKQVAILVPTTILADQHYKTFSQRLDGFPVEVEVLSRFRTAREQKEVLERLREGKVDILIGTHRIVSRDVEFRDLGLMVIDEEQRFGVSVKEKLKRFRASMDVLTLTATPIPRTLQFSLMGARDLSIIRTPPPNRQPVYTEIHSFNHELIRDAILQEKSRGGQAFFIHNRVKNIEEVAEMIRAIVPGIRVRHAHGQMKPSALEKIIHDFYNHKFDLLVSTNIVENGIDIANANTILINNANHFGLSELHQLRGRVGRSNRKAYCYLLTPPIQTLPNEARKRLTALEEFSDLGSGFNIAMRDLDIRGAGDILGAEQSGFINEIGFEMYSKILDDAVRELKEEEFGDLFEATPRKASYPESQVEFDQTALLDNSYVEDHVERLNLYRKLARADKPEDLDDWEKELADRFGPLPKAASELLAAARIRFYASRLLMDRVTIRSGRMWLLCPKSETEAGNHYYDSGLFQQTLDLIASHPDHEYQLLQKKGRVRIVIHDIDDTGKALDYLKSLYEAYQKTEEATV